MQYQNYSVGSGGAPMTEGERHKLFNNTKSLGNSLGTANKKSLPGIDRDNSTLNEN
jgi:hypothetical protein